VLRIEIPNACARCLRDGYLQPATTFMAHPHFRGEQLLYERTLSARIALPLGSAPVRPVCADHMPDGVARRFTLLSLCGLTGTEVTLLPDADQPATGGAAAA
jgi:hypothetical protein